jgi:hypothetical protein
LISIHILTVEQITYCIHILSPLHLYGQSGDKWLAYYKSEKASRPVKSVDLMLFANVMPVQEHRCVRGVEWGGVWGWRGVWVG